MAITNADTFFGAARQLIGITKTTSFTTVANNPSTFFDSPGSPGAGTITIGNTTTGIVPTDATAGFPTINAFGGGATGYLSTIEGSGSVIGRGFIYDRLWHAGSVLMTSLATTTFSSQPSYTSRLPAGGTDYGDLEIFIEINVAVSATATTIAVAYTNEAGTTGRTTGATATLSGFATRRLIRMPLQAGDKGVQKIESVTVGGTVASTGSFNVIVARRVASFGGRVANYNDIRGWDTTGGPEIFADSALWLVGQPDSTASGAIDVIMTILNG